MTRDEHMKWAKERALEYLPANPQEAVTSMMSDLDKHDETRNILRGPLAMIGLLSMDSPDEARRYIEGFN